MKLLKNKSGFTLIEIMTATGILSVIIMIIFNAQKMSIKSTGDLKQNADINEMIQLITSELTRVEVCNKNFVTSPPIPIPVTNKSLTSIVNQFGQAIITKGQPYGEKIDSITDILLTTAGARGTITIKYMPHKGLYDGVPSEKSFSTYLNVFSLNSSGTLDSCFSDIQAALRSAVQQACSGDGAKWEDYTVAPPYGRCTHATELQGSTGTAQSSTPAGISSTNTFACPNGELLKEIVLGTNKRILKCAPFDTNTGLPQCASWEYMTGVDANGAPICKNIISIFLTNGLLTTVTPNTFTVISLSCSGGQVLVGISATGTPNCVNPYLSQNCPAGRVATAINSDGSLNCAPYPDNNACTGGNGGTFMTAISAAGVVTCDYPRFFGGCSGSNVVTAVDASANIICSPMTN